MGKGDIRTEKGKRARGTYGKTRTKNKKFRKYTVAPVKPKSADKAAATADQEAAKTAKKPAAKKKTAAKKSTTTKKSTAKKTATKKTATAKKSTAKKATTKKSSSAKKSSSKEKKD